MLQAETSGFAPQSFQLGSSSRQGKLRFFALLCHSSSPVTNVCCSWRAGFLLSNFAFSFTVSPLYSGKCYRVCSLFFVLKFRFRWSLNWHSPGFNSYLLTPFAGQPTLRSSVGSTGRKEDNPTKERVGSFCSVTG